MSFGLNTFVRRIGILAALAAAGCGGSSDVVEFVDHAWHQARHVSTDTISVPEEIGLENVRFGWETVAVEGEPSHLAMQHEPARLSFFSADGDATALEFELRRLGATSADKIYARVRLNRQGVGRLFLSAGWRSQRLEIPAESVRRGWNLLEFELRGKESRALTAQTFDLRSLRIESATGRPGWNERSERVETLGGEREGRSGRLLLPSSSWVEVFIEPSKRGRLEASYALRARPDSGNGSIIVYASAFDGISETMLATQTLDPRGDLESPAEIDVDLESWAGRSIRVRLGVTGGGNGLVEWRNARVTGAIDLLDQSAPLITRKESEKSGRLGRPDVFVILLDAARGDAFSPFGGTWETPAAERLAAAGTVFTEAFSASSWTGQSVAAALTGLYPDTIGAGAWGSRLSTSVPTLAELMWRNGYRTVGWTHHPFYGVQRDLKRGFEEFYFARALTPGAPAAVDLLGATDKPTFALVHLMPPHWPYEPPEPFRGLYTAGYEGEMSVEAKALNQYARNVAPEEIDPEDLEYVRGRYQEHVTYADSLVAGLLAELETLERFEDSLIILLSDHGEAFFEHGEFLHAKGLFREMVHVPLIIKWPRTMRGHRSQVEDPVSLVDLVPTLVDGLGLDDEGTGFQGRSLLPVAVDGTSHQSGVYAVTRGSASVERTSFPELSLRARGWRVIRDGLAGSARLFQVEVDPLESSDLAATDRLRARLYERAALRQSEYNRRLAVSLGTGPELQQMSPDVKRQLEALGYLN